MSAPTEDTSTMSPECALAHRPGYSKLHQDCRQTRDIPLPQSRGILLVPRCTCSHHRYTSPG
ncbi:hypothetical protein [Streptomyces fuscichromogenes]|uniref:Uncharacterized protein n=1 Tax=Streptomyces fuscichromogenes TaxID=1324013 RepID=A0A917XIX4_9ACTN|nr:hypothetical protein [Streptomyces fuscichromogenes]GGN30428.1 hypothetical protein GCM10011578_067510 [Streptomyces fuscichromogenes]